MTGYLLALLIVALTIPAVWGACLMAVCLLIGRQAARPRAVTRYGYGSKRQVLG